MLKSVGNLSTRFGNQTVENGNVIVATAGKGIDFSGASAASNTTIYITPGEGM